MVINNLKKSEIKILLDIEDLKNAQITLREWMHSPKNNLRKLFKNFPELSNINQKEINIYSYKFITFYIFIKT